MSLEELKKYTYFAKYARYNKSAQRRETWEEAVQRVKSMHLRRYPQAKEEIDWAFDEYVLPQKVLGSQRALQFGGEPIERKHARIYNCIASYCDRLRFFQEAFILLLSGNGVGLSVQKHHVAKLPPFSRKSSISKRHVIEDSIEGWADALGVLLSSYFADPVFPQYEGYQVEFDYSLIRPAGSPLSSAAGKAPGPEPLRRSLEKIRQLLDRCLGERLRPIDAYDIVMHASDAVLSGGVRRSAALSIFSPDDEEMLHAKTGNWFSENPQRARSNNSMMLLRDQVTEEDFRKIFQAVRQFGEPGFVFSDNTELVLNPCCEIGLYPVDEVTGKTGWQACNLSTINGQLVKTREDFVLAATAAAMIGTLQAGYTDFPYLGEVSERIIRREALLGVSITGMMENPDILLNEDYQQFAANMVAHTNVTLAKKIGINPSARMTCIKPEGTTSCMLGTSSGIHPHHARRYFRRVQANNMEPCLQWFAKKNPAAVERSIWSANDSDSVITFCIEAPLQAKTKTDVTALSLLEQVRKTQLNWVKTANNWGVATQPWLSHNVSNTINVHDDEWEEVAEYLYKYREDFTAVSMLPATGDLDYFQAPMCAVLTREEIVDKYGVDTDLIDTIHLKGSSYSLYIQEPESEWISTIAKEKFSGDVRKTTYFLKDLLNWRQWNLLKETFQSVDYTEMTEYEDRTKPMDSLACAGGVCDVTF